MEEMNKFGVQSPGEWIYRERPLPWAIKPLHPRFEELSLGPRRMSEHAAGYDIAAALDKPMMLSPGQRAAVPCGFAMALPPGYEAQMRPRSGLAAKHGVTVLNAPGTIDADYRGEVQAILINHGHLPFAVEPGMRIAQLVIARVEAPVVQVVDDLPSSERSESGMGSTGTRNMPIINPAVTGIERGLEAGR